MTRRALVDSVGPLVARALSEAGIGADRVAGIGLTNQRETTVVWDRATGRAIGPALVWQDRRTSGLLRAATATVAAWIADRTGLVLDPYFSATKIAWLLDHVPGARRPRAEAGELAAGTVDSPADLAPDRWDTPRHRRDQRLPDLAHGPPDDRMGRRPLPLLRSP